MRPQILLLTSWSLSAVASPLEKRQISLASIVNALPPSSIIKPLSVDIVKPQLRTTATRKKVRYGPFKLPANKIGASKPAEGEGHSHGAPPKSGPIDPIAVLTAQKPMDPNGFSQMRVLSEGAMCTNCTVLAGNIDVIFENGTRADISGGVYLHHVITIDLTKKNKRWVSTCSPPAGSAPKAPSGLAGNLNTFLGGAVVSLLPRRSI